MIFAVDNEVMRASDKRTIENGISELDLMKRASLGLLDCVKEHLPHHNIAIVCGSGNNGGDGYSLACELLKFPQISFKIFGKKPKTNAGKYYFDEIAKNSELFCDISTMQDLSKFDLVVDCLLGTGFKGVINEEYGKYISIINQTAKYVISCDIASGLNGNNGFVEKIAVKANQTAVIQAYKLGHFLNDGKDYSGKLKLCDVGIEIVGKRYYIVDEEYAKRAFPPKKQNCNKGTFGSVGIIACSKNMVGAGLLSATSAVCAMGECAMTAGSGLCKLFVPDQMVSALWDKVIHTTVFGQSEIQKHKFDSIAFGMGIGDNVELFNNVLNCNAKKVIDADALNILSKNMQEIEKLKGAILTPHPKEFSRLTNLSVDEILQNPIAIAEKFAKQNNVILLLKGCTTIVTDGDKTMLNIEGSPCQAKGGSGDVLSGIIASLLARNIPTYDCAIIASFIAGKSGKMLESQTNEYTPLALDLAKNTQKAINEILS